MKKITFIAALFFSVSIFAQTNIETIVVVRHGEKPLGSYGQLNCQGLNRSLALPAYFAAHFPKPDDIFAPNPSIKNHGWSYVRPLATIEPTAIRLAMPVNTQIGFDQPQALVNELLQSKYHNAVIYVAWEHKYIQKIAEIFLHTFHQEVTLKTWKNNDYNRVYVFKIDWSKKPAQLFFSQTSENMNHLSTECPQ